MNPDGPPPRCDSLGVHVVSAEKRHCVYCDEHVDKGSKLDCHECREQILQQLMATS